ncbi:hypothetical protein [Lysobacter olei]
MNTIDLLSAIAAYGLLLTLLLFLVMGWWMPLAVAVLYTAACCWAFGNCPQEKTQPERIP